MADDVAVADTLVRLARELDRQAMVIGAHGHRVLGKTALGNTVKGVLRKAPCPVLVDGAAHNGIERTASAVRSALPNATWRDGRLVPGIRPDIRVTAAVADAFAAAGRGFEPDPPPLPFATDFGSISHRAPAALIGVGRPEGWAFHTDQGAAQLTSTAGLDVATDMAIVLALAAVRLGEP